MYVHLNLQVENKQFDVDTALHVCMYVTLCNTELNCNVL